MNVKAQKCVYKVYLKVVQLVDCYSAAVDTE